MSISPNFNGNLLSPQSYIILYFGYSVRLIQDL